MGSAINRAAADLAVAGAPERRKGSVHWRIGESERRVMFWCGCELRAGRRSEQRNTTEPSR